jgi:transposase
MELYFKMSKNKITTKERHMYVNRVFETAFQGQEVRYISPSRYIIGKKHVEIHVTDPKSDEYLFGIYYHDKVDYEILVCVGDYYAFIIPGIIVKKWNMHLYEKGYRPVIKFIKNSGWYINFKTQDGTTAKENIDEYRVDIIKNSEIRKFDKKIICISLGIKNILNIS